MASNGEPIPHPTVDERVATGKAQRKRVPRSSHGQWAPPPDREPLAMLEAQATTRVEELVPIRYGRMAVSPFTFYRGAAKVMAADLASAPHSGLDVQLCGDAHLANFGGFASPDRSLVFDLNDFDETLPGPVRMGRQTAGRQLRRRRPRSRSGRKGRDQRSSPSRPRRTAKRWLPLRRCPTSTSGTPSSTPIRSSRSGVPKPSTKALKNLQRTVAKAESKDRLKALAKLTHEVDGELQFVSDPPLDRPGGRGLRRIWPRRRCKRQSTRRSAMYRRTLSG